ncbi:hypothetical protein WN982_20645 [Paraburkholderia sp. IMGN_8]|uniref:hypothetical protein n=1 Tax=Paraburkholderia sp. IMGN_8 TaxID=3136564 RepID=UPI003100D2B6
MGKRAPDSERVRNDLNNNILPGSARLCFSFQLGILTGEQLTVQHQSFLSNHRLF